MFKATFRSPRRVALLLGIVLVLLAAVLVLPSREAEAIAGPGICVYYSDATFTQVVGARGTGCCEEPISWGVTTLYRRCEQLLCPDVICPIYQ
ncbi:MAG TPA: DUF6289 family protein [Thermoanaerobaculia bacterium]|nr:DUF6289 family protein [Thermoanaerobaculia bacterium]